MATAQTKPKSSWEVWFKNTVHVYTPMDMSDPATAFKSIRRAFDLDVFGTLYVRDLTAATYTERLHMVSLFVPAVPRTMPDSRIHKWIHDYNRAYQKHMKEKGLKS